MKETTSALIGKKILETQNNVLQWAEDKQLLDSKKKFSQYAKFVEEASEVIQAMSELEFFSGTPEEKGKAILKLVDAIGDTQVTLIILAKQCGIDYNAALEAAYNEIKDRTGKTVAGTFVKD